MWSVYVHPESDCVWVDVAGLNIDPLVEEVESYGDYMEAVYRAQEIAQENNYTFTTGE